MAKSKELGFAVFNEVDNSLGSFFASQGSNDAEGDALVHAARLSGKSSADEPVFGVAAVSVALSADEVAEADVPERPESDNDAEVRRLAEGGSPASEIDKKAKK